MSNNLRESSDFVKHWSNNLWNLFDDCVGSKEYLIFFGPVLDWLLFLVEFLEGVKIDDINVELILLGFFKMLSISDKADLKVWSWDSWKSDGTTESLILLWIVVLE